MTHAIQKKNLNSSYFLKSHQKHDRKYKEIKYSWAEHDS